MLPWKFLNPYNIAILLRIVSWQHLGSLWPLIGNTKKKWPADISTRIRDFKFARPNASHWTIIGV